MEKYLKIIQIAFMTFPFIALLITIPYMIKEYRKYGSLTPLKTIIVYSFILYMMTAYFMIIMPLPHRSEVALMTQPYKQLEPFYFIKVMNHSTNFIVNDFSTYFSTLKNPAVYTVIFNVFLTFPFGIYLRYYFKKKWWQVFIFTFFLSLFYEITQLSGLYGIYPRPYRLFDVDDLIVNTFGGMLGFWFCPLFTFFLPKRDRLDELAYYKGLKKVSFSRRLIAIGIDIFVFGCFYAVFIYILKFKDIIGNLIVFKYVFFVIYTIIIYITNGYSFGKMIVKIRLVDNNDKHISFKKVFIRYFFLCLILFIIPEVILKLIFMLNDSSTRLLLLIILTFLYIILLGYIFVHSVIKKNHFFYEKWSKTENKNETFKK